MKTSSNFTKEVENYFKNKPVLRAYIFGSYARLETNKDSDIDILVELDYSSPIGLEFVRMQLDLQNILDRKVDLITEKSISKHIKARIDEEKVLIYER